VVPEDLNHFKEGLKGYFGLRITDDDLRTPSKYTMRPGG
jgi:hypothetical protein